MEKHSMHKFFEENILPHYNSIYYYALKTLKNKEAAEDVVQTTLEKAWKNLHKLRDTRKAKSWGVRHREKRALGCAEEAGYAGRV